MNEREDWWNPQRDQNVPECDTPENPPMHVTTAHRLLDIARPSSFVDVVPDESMEPDTVRFVHHHTLPVGKVVLDGTPRLSFEPDWERNTIAFRMEVPPPLSPEEAARLRVEWAARQAAEAEGRDTFEAALRAAGGLPAAMLDLHARSEYEPRDRCVAEDDVGWPCETLTLLAEHAGIEVPEALRNAL